MEFDTSIDFEYFLIQVLTSCVGAFISLVIYEFFGVPMDLMKQLSI